MDGNTENANVKRIYELIKNKNQNNGSNSENVEETENIKENRNIITESEINVEKTENIKENRNIITKSEINVEETENIKENRNIIPESEINVEETENIKENRNIITKSEINVEETENIKENRNIIPESEINVEENGNIKENRNIIPESEINVEENGNIKENRNIITESEINVEENGNVKINETTMHESVTEVIIGSKPLSSSEQPPSLLSSTLRSRALEKTTDEEIYSSSSILEEYLPRLAKLNVDSYMWETCTQAGKIRHFRSTLPRRSRSFPPKPSFQTSDSCLAAVSLLDLTDLIEKEEKILCISKLPLAELITADDESTHSHAIILNTCSVSEPYRVQFEDEKSLSSASQIHPKPSNYLYLDIHLIIFSTCLFVYSCILANDNDKAFFLVSSFLVIALIVLWLLNILLDILGLKMNRKKFYSIKSIFICNFIAILLSFTFEVYQTYKIKN